MRNLGLVMLPVATCLVTLGIRQPSAADLTCWQQDVRYEIRATLDAEGGALTGTETLYYTNNSPDTLPQVWFHAYPNAFKDENSLYAKDRARYGMRAFHQSRSSARGYIQIDSLGLDGGDEHLEWEYKPGDETEMRVDLPRPILPGATVRFDIGFSVKIPYYFERLGRSGCHYQISQWYPKIVVYDDRGWHPDGYRLLGEYYGDFGTFDVWLTLPADYVVGATGVLVEPDAEVCLLDSLAAETRHIISLSGVERQAELDSLSGKRSQWKTALYPAGTKTLHFRAEKVHDFAWFADPTYLLSREDHEGVWVNVYFFSTQIDSWSRVAQYVEDTLDHYGKVYCPYPYPQITVVKGNLGIGDAMEYPSLILLTSGKASQDSSLHGLEMGAEHEVGHQWFYGIVGSNEMDEAWLDEGMTAFSDHRCFEAKHGRYGNLTDWPKGLRWLPQLDSRSYALISYQVLASRGYDEPILQPSYGFHDAISYGIATYMKAPWVMWTLRGVLGDSVFDDAMRDYVREWQFSHPHTEDFIEVMERASGRDLGPFFDDFLKTSKVCDYAVGRVSTVAADGGKRTEVEIANKGDIALPSLPVRLMTTEGIAYDKRLKTGSHNGTLTFETESAPASIEIDPDHTILEIDHTNNRWPAARRWSLFGLPPSPYEVDYAIWPYLWYDDDVDGLRVGASLRRGNILTQRFFTTAGFNYATGSNKWGYNGSLKTRLPLNCRRTSLEVWCKDVEGYDQQRITLSSRFAPVPFGPPYCEIRGEVFRNDVRDLDYYQPSDWQTGATVGAQASVEVGTRGVHHDGLESLLLRHCLDNAGGEFDYTKAEATLIFAWQWTARLATRQRLYLGGMQGAPPLQDRIYLAGGLDPDRRRAAVLDRRGSRMVPLERWIFEGGPGLRGYSGIYMNGLNPAGHYGLGLSLEAKFGPPRLGLAAFLDAGNVWQDWDSIGIGTLRADAGLEFYAGPLKVAFPVWLSDPPEGGDHLAFRWLLGMDVIDLSKMISVQ